MSNDVWEDGFQIRVSVYEQDENTTAGTMVQWIRCKGERWQQAYFMGERHEAIALVFMDWMQERYKPLETETPEQYVERVRTIP